MELKLGDKVLVKNSVGRSGKCGLIGTVIAFGGLSSIEPLIEYDEKIEGHNGNGLILYTSSDKSTRKLLKVHPTSGNCWYALNDFEIISDTPKDKLRKALYKEVI